MWRELLLVVTQVQCGSALLILLVFLRSVDRGCTGSMRLLAMCYTYVFVSRPAVMSTSGAGKGSGVVELQSPPFPK